MSVSVYHFVCWFCALTLLVCVLQGHKYVLQAEVLYKSWNLDESQLAFVHMLRDLEKNEMRGAYLHTSQTQHQTVSYTLAQVAQGKDGKESHSFYFAPTYIFFLLI